MDSSLLLELGLRKNEAKIYEALLRYGGSGVTTIALRSAVDRRTVYDTMQRLVEKGLVYEIFGQKETTYEAVDPTKLRELLEEKMHRLDGALPAFLSAYRQHLAPERAYIYKGIEGAKNYIRLALQTGEDVYTIGGSGSWLDPRLRMFVEWFLKEAAKKKMRFHNLFNHSVQALLPEAPQLVSSRYKFLPDGFETTGAVDVFGDYVVTFSGMKIGKMPDDLTIFVIASAELAETYRTWWKMLWSLLPDGAKPSARKHRRKPKR